MANDSYIIEIMKEQLKVTPKKGWNICILDEYADIGERLTVIRHVNTREEAEEIADNFEDGKVFIYGEEDG